MNFTNEVINGDCGEILKQCPEGFVNMIFTSPPYADIPGKYKDGYKGLPPEEYNDWMIPKVKEFYRILNNKGSFILNIETKVIDGFKSTYVLDLVSRIVKETGFFLYEELIWQKGKSLCHPKRFRNPLEKIYWFVKQRDFVLNLDAMRVEYDKKSLVRMLRPIKKRFARTEENQNKMEYKNWQKNPLGALPSTLIRIGSESKRICDFHCATFPSKLSDYFIKGGSNPGDLILDPFAGTFTTCLSARNLGRNYCGIELSTEYCKFGYDRLSSIDT